MIMFGDSSEVVFDVPSNQLVVSCNGKHVSFPVGFVSFPDFIRSLLYPGSRSFRSFKVDNQTSLVVSFDNGVVTIKKLFIDDRKAQVIDLSAFDSVKLGQTLHSLNSVDSVNHDYLWKSIRRINKVQNQNVYKASTLADIMFKPK